MCVCVCVAGGRSGCFSFSSSLNTLATGVTLAARYMLGGPGQYLVGVLMYTLQTGINIEGWNPVGVLEINIEPY